MSESDDKTQTHLVLSQGTMVGHYRIVEKIGAGGMGEVFLAEDTKLDRKVALKFLPSQIAQDADVRTRFTREAKAVAKLDHPNIVTIHEVGEFNDRPFFAMQYINGKTLQHYCSEETLSVGKIVNLILQIAEGLSKAHAVGITHRDIKSANIIVDQDFRLKILDFGLATVQGGDALTKAGSTLGTVAYMSPEQAKGSKVDHRSDLFSLGIVMYELITGRTPFKRTNDTGTMHAIINENPEPLERYKSDVPPELQRIVSKCLAKLSDERYQSAADLAADLRILERTATSGEHEISGQTAASQPSIAVLPFANMSADPENEYFADGLTEELLNVLAKNPELKVIGRTSSFAFKGKQEDLREIGKKLGVGTILEGSVRKAGNRVRITVQLVKTSDGFHLWSETYDKVLEDIFAVQDEIAGAVAKALDVTLLGKSSEKQISNPESYALLLKGQQAMLKWNKESALEAIDLFQKAIEIEPDSARAWAGIARVYMMQSSYGFEDTQSAYVKAKDAALKALALDDKLAEAYEVMGLIRWRLELHFDEADSAFRKAYELAPSNTRMVSSLSAFLGSMGKFEESLSMSKLAVELDPLNPETHVNRGRILFANGQLDETRVEIQKALELSPEMTSLYGNLGWTYLLQGKFDEALSATEKEKAPGYRYCVLAKVYHAMGEKQKSDEALEHLLSMPDKISWAYQIALVYSYRNEVDDAFKWLEIARTSRDAGIPLAKISPFFKNLHDDPRWPVFLEKVGFPE
ncbi:MAG: protein kinase [candidate division Zixibacteria bacterium]|nr:protein kinase [candidate division Zixibacteria bacterium]